MPSNKKWWQRVGKKEEPPKYEPIKIGTTPWTSTTDYYSKLYKEAIEGPKRPYWALDRTGVPIVKIGGQIFRVKKEDFLASLSEMLSLASRLGDTDGED